MVLHHNFIKMSLNNTFYSPFGWREVLSKRAFKNRISTCSISNDSDDSKNNPNLFFEYALIPFQNCIKHFLVKGPLKVNVVLSTDFIKYPENTLRTRYFNTKNEIIYDNTNLSDWYNIHVVETILRKISEFQDMGSGEILECIHELKININKYISFNGGMYIELPNVIKQKHACINLKVNDYTCFPWAVVSALFPVNANSDKLISYPHFSSVLNMSGIHLPMSLSQIRKFENQNDISINIFTLQKEGSDDYYYDPVNDKFAIFTVIPLHISDNIKGRHINLLMISRYINEEVVSHFCWIKDLSKLVKSQLTKRSNKIFVCDRCLSYFYLRSKLDEHIEDCKRFKAVRYKIPKESSRILKFKDFYQKELLPFIVYCDIECILEPVSQNLFIRGMQIYRKHIPMYVGVFVKCSYNNDLSYYKMFEGESCIQKFVIFLYKLASELANIYSKPISMNNLSSDEKLSFETSIVCHICEQKFTDAIFDLKVKDHCHLTGNYIAAAHTSCNLNRKIPTVVPIVFHNLTNYDANFIIEEISEKKVEVNGKDMIKNPGKVKLLPLNQEKYKSFSKIINTKKFTFTFKFIDSLNFLNESLSKLGSYLKNDQFSFVRNYFSSDKEFKLLSKKGFLPYDYLDSFQKLNDNALPSIEKFYNTITKNNISNENYAHCQLVWTEMNCVNLGMYVQLYLKSDVLLLTAVFENFRKMCMDTYQLDPAHFVSLPSYTWQALLKYTHVKLELLNDINMILFFEKAIRGGLSQVSHRYSKANNPYLDNYDSTKPTSYILYFDFVNLYGFAMCQYLPIGNFFWLKDNEINNLDIMNIEKTGKIGYILEVDLEYPKEIHDLHYFLPLCPEKLIPPGSKCNKKLLATLHNKEKYVLHFINLQQCLRMGMKLKKVHRIIGFHQKDWIRPYIELNTQKRTEANNKFEENLFKLFINASFGKTIENVRKYRDVKLLSSFEGRYGAGRYIAKPNFKSRTVINENLILVEMKRLLIQFSKPIYLGMIVLDLAKAHLYDFHYNYMMSKYPLSKIFLNYTDTDSLIYQIFTENVYLDLKPDLKLRFDTSNYSSSNPFNYPLLNRKVMGKVKDEMGGQIISAFVGLRSKMYSIIVSDQIIKKAKGTDHNIVKNFLRFEHYEKVLFKNALIKSKQSQITSAHFNVFSAHKTKIALSCDDDKRCILSNKINTLPWGHYKIQIIYVDE